MLRKWFSNVRKFIETLVFYIAEYDTAYGDRKVKIDYGKFEALKIR